MRSRKAVVVLAVAGAFMTGCAGLAEIRDFAARSKQAAESFPRMMADLRQSVVREKQYDALRAGARLEAAIALSESACRAEPLCANADDYVAVSRVMENYMRVMGHLAADEIASYDKSIDGLMDKLNNATGIRREASTAAGSLGKFLAGAAANGYRQKVLAKTLTGNNASFHTITAALSDFVEDYRTQLRRERTAMRGYFELAVAAHSAQEPLTRLLIYDRYQDRLAALETRLAAAEEYKSFLATVATAHQELSDKANRLSSAEARRLIAGYAVAVDSQVQAIRRVF